jgi:hypothetical protein
MLNVYLFSHSIKILAPKELFENQGQLRNFPSLLYRIRIKGLLDFILTLRFKGFIQNFQEIIFLKKSPKVLHEN